MSPVYTPNTKPTLQWNGLPENYKFDPFADSEHTDDYHTKDNKDAWGPKVCVLARASERRRSSKRPSSGSRVGAWQAAARHCLVQQLL